MNKEEIQKEIQAVEARLAELRGRMTEDKVIDLTKVIANNVPMQLEGGSICLLKKIVPSLVPFKTDRSINGWGVSASAINFSNEWVPNIRGLNIWPAGVLIHVRFSDGATSHFHEPNAFNWETSGRYTTPNKIIIASRFRRLRGGWRMPTADDYIG